MESWLTFLQRCKGKIQQDYCATNWIDVFLYCSQKCMRVKISKNFKWIHSLNWLQCCLLTHLAHPRQEVQVASGPGNYTSILTWMMTTKMLAST